MKCFVSSIHVTYLLKKKERARLINFTIWINSRGWSSSKDLAQQGLQESDTVDPFPFLKRGLILKGGCGSHTHTLLTCLRLFSIMKFLRI